MLKWTWVTVFAQLVFVLNSHAVGDLIPKCEFKLSNRSVVHDLQSDPDEFMEPYGRYHRTYGGYQDETFLQNAVKLFPGMDKEVLMFLEGKGREVREKDWVFPQTTMMEMNNGHVAYKDKDLFEFLDLNFLFELPTASKLNRNALPKKITGLVGTYKSAKNEQDLFRFLRDSEGQPYRKILSEFIDENQKLTGWREHFIQPRETVGPLAGIDILFYKDKLGQLMESARSGTLQDEELESGRDPFKPKIIKQTAAYREIRAAAYRIHKLIAKGPLRLKQMASMLEPLFLVDHPNSIAQIFDKLIRESRRDPKGYIKVLSTLSVEEFERINKTLEMALRVLHDLSFQVSILKDLEVYNLEFPELAHEGARYSVLSVVNGHLPSIYIEKPSGPSVANSFTVAGPDDFRVYSLRGPPYQGKTTFAVMLANIKIMAMLGLPVFAAKGTKVTPGRIIIYLKPAGSIESAESGFSSEVGAIGENVIPYIDQNTLLLMDEALTSTASRSAAVILHRLMCWVQSKGAIAIFSNHFESIDNMITTLSPQKICNIHADNRSIRQGPIQGTNAMDAGSVKVLKNADWPAEITNAVEADLKSPQ